jgi:hypothetical protein
MIVITSLALKVQGESAGIIGCVVARLDGGDGLIIAYGGCYCVS